MRFIPRRHRRGVIRPRLEQAELASEARSVGRLEAGGEPGYEASVWYGIAAPAMIALVLRREELQRRSLR